METVRVYLAGIWVALMLSYLLGDVLRIFSGDFPQKMNTQQFTNPMWLGIAIMMSAPIFMVLISLMAAHPLNRWANIIVALFFFVFNLFSLPSYPSAYDRYLGIVGLAFNVLTLWHAWHWSPTT